MKHRRSQMIISQHNHNLHSTFNNLRYNDLIFRTLASRELNLLSNKLYLRHKIRTRDLLLQFWISIKQGCPNNIQNSEQTFVPILFVKRILVILKFSRRLPFMLRLWRAHLSPFFIKISCIKLKQKKLFNEKWTLFVKLVLFMLHVCYLGVLLMLLVINIIKMSYLYALSDWV